MDSLGVDVQVVSPYVGFYNYHLDAAVAVATSRAINDEIARDDARVAEALRRARHPAHAGRQGRRSPRSSAA